MSSITFPSIDFENLYAEVTEKRFPSRKISTFAQKRIRELFEEHEAISRNFHDFQKGNMESKDLVLSGIEQISSKCTGKYPVSTKVHQLQELKALLAPIEQKYCAFRDLLSQEDCRAKGSLLLHNEQEAREGGHLKEASQDLQEEYPNHLITSSPGAIDVNTTESEILDFSDVQIRIYTDRFFRADESKAGGIKRFIRQNPQAKSLAHIPINLSILCALYDKDDTLFQSEAFLTNSALFDRMINQFYKVFLPRREDSQKVEPLSSCLEEIAYNASLKEKIYTSEEEVAQIVYRKKLDIEDVRKLGFFRIENKEGSFTHPIFQEYFAALYISRFYESFETRPQALGIVERLKFNPKFVQILSLVAGALSLSENQDDLQTYFDDLHSEPRDYAEIYELTLLARCFEECNCPTNLSQHGDFIDRVKQFINSPPRKELSTTLFRGNQQLLFCPDIVALFTELLNQGESRLKLIPLLQESTSYSGHLPRAVFQKLQECLYEGVPQIGIVSILENIGNKEAIKILISLVADPKVGQNVRSSAADAIGKIASAGERIGEKGIGTLIFLTADPKADKYVRTSAADAIRKIASAGGRIGEKGIETLISLIANPELVDQYVRYAAASAIGEIDLAGERIGEKRVETLIFLIADPEVSLYVRSSAASALGKIDSGGEGVREKGIETLISMATDPKIGQNERYLAAKALGEIASAGARIGEKGVEALISFVADLEIDNNVRLSVASAFGEIASAGARIGEKGIEGLISLVADPEIDLSVRKLAVYTLGKIAKAGERVGEKRIETLILLIADPEVDPSMRTIVVKKALGKIASAGERIGEKRVEALVSLVADPDVSLYVCSSAAEALGRIALAGERIGENGLEALISLIADPEEQERLRFSAARAIGKVASAGEKIGKKGVEALFSLFTDPKMGKYVRSSAADAIGKIASAGERIGEKGIGTLIFLTADPKADKYVRSSAADAIRKIAIAGERMGKKGLEVLISLVADSKVEGFLLSSVTEAIGNLSPIDVMECYPRNLEVLRLYCQAAQRALIKQKGNWIISSQFCITQAKHTKEVI